MTKKHAVVRSVALDPGTRFREPPHVPPAERLNEPALGFMTPQSRVQVLTYDSVANAEIGNIVATLNTLKLKHFLVAETDPKSPKQVVRGMFSRTKIGSNLRMNLNLVEVGPQSLAEMAHDKS